MLSPVAAGSIRPGQSCPVQRARDQTADQRRHAKDPKLRHGGSTRKQRRTDRAGGIDRDSRHIDPDQVDGGLRQTDRQSGKTRSRAGAGRPKDYRHEKEGHDGFENQSGAQRIFPKIARTVVILTQTTRLARAARSDQINRTGAQDRANDLSDRILHRITHRHPSCCHHAKGHSRVKMRARDSAKPISCRHNGQTKGQ